MPFHHLPEEILEGRVVGAVEPALAVLVDAHAELCASCRATAVMLAEAGGLLLAEAPAQELSEGFEESLLSRLDDAAPQRAPAADAILPSAVAALSGRFEALRWRWAGPGIQAVDLLPRPGLLPLRLLRMAPGVRLPVHDHAGIERAVVLAGGWTDAFGHFTRGDVAWVSADARGHDQRIDDGEACVALVLNDAPVLPRNALLRLGARWLGV